MRAGTWSRGAVLAIICLLPITAAGQPVRIARFTGSAKIGAATRQVAIRFACALDRSRINNLAVGVEIPDAERFKSAFDVDPFEGPGALSAKMRLTAADGTQADLGSTGSFGGDGAPGTSFTFDSAATPREKLELQKLQALASALSRGAGKLMWRIENPAKSKPPIEAVADLTDLDAAHLKAAVGPCGVR